MTAAAAPLRVAVIGGGISGLAAAHTLLETSTSDGRPLDVVVYEARPHVGGIIKTSPFAGLPAVDEGADAFLIRVPDAIGLARAVGIEDQLTHPVTGRAAIWHGRLRAIPDGLVLGVPSSPLSLVRSGLFSARGIARAGLEPLLPATPADHDSLGRWVRSRFGDEVHERLVDPLVGSIYAADTDHFSLGAVPQLVPLAQERSALLAARRARKSVPTGAVAPIFAAPVGGMGTLVSSVAEAVQRLGGRIDTGAAITSIESDGPVWRVDGERFDGVVLACPAQAAARLLTPVTEQASVLASIDTASVVIITAAVPTDAIPADMTLSGYLVPKPDQRHVTAVSFASNKWAHLRTDDGTCVLRISLGRDGSALPDGDDERLTELAIEDVERHLGARHGALAPSVVRVTRWPGAFPQYRPGHLQRIDELERHLAGTTPGLVVAGASQRGMGIPACIAQARRCATRLRSHFDDMRD
jgi:protoporphyrinogen/coproporphyrinogen III oxidase